MHSNSLMQRAALGLLYYKVIMLAVFSYHGMVKSSGPQAALLQKKASGGDEIPAGLFQILKDNAKKCCT